ncbi:MAG: ABC transporter ATP-binding protein [Anaerolineae bacterium]|nr:ABC transporter ATP-binding protein [Candidatus Roseilinea sp.]MDW8449204.1 ABC transporter ATP-binding protein [Anaerolineae bacterium]
MSENAKTAGEPALLVEDLWVEYPARRGVVKAVRGVSFELRRGETLALIGESGSGKTTLGLALVRLLPKAARIKQGRIMYYRNGTSQDVLALNAEQLRRFRWQECAMVFQGAQNALNPVLRIEAQFLDTARAHGMTDAKAVRERAIELLKMVQLDPQRVMHSFPHELSGGMRQRVLIALGLLLQPQVIILDEPTTALDILTQRSVIEVLRRLRTQLDFSLIFISHDLSLAAELADRVATVYAGAIVEIGSVYDIFERPRHPYTLALTRSVPTVTGEMHPLASIPGSPPDLINPPLGCAFHPRCPYATDQCRSQEPRLERVGDDQFAACWHWQEVKP